MNYDYDFTETDVYAIESFILLADYNRYEQDILDIMEQLQAMFQSKAEYDCATRPDWTLKCGRDKVDEFGGIFWAWLVLQYGDYGTSPRFGWIYKETAKKLYNIMSNIRNTYK